MPADAARLRYHAPRAWVGGRWESDVLLTVDPEGRWQEVTIGADAAARRGAVALAGPVLPGLVDAHSHAFQRAMAGLAERSHGAADDFWSWRERMYRVALRVTPDQLEALAAYLYTELLQAGYTQVCEFHYLHHDVDGHPYADASAMSLALVRAAQRTGIGLTLLPTLYMRAGFDGEALSADQRRFAGTPESVLRIVDGITPAGGRVRAGVALHSLRAVDEGALATMAEECRRRDLPLHIHIAEQPREVSECRARHGARPIEWLLANIEVDARWNLVHATQATPAELDGVRDRGAGIVICPSTEANLGDGVFDLPHYGGAWSIGSDSHVTRSWQEELRLLEYSQRLTLRRRNVAGAPAAAAVAGGTAAVLFGHAVAGGSQAAGCALNGIAAGQRADFVVVDTAQAALVGVPADHLLDALVFSSPAAPFRQVFVAGEPVPTPDPAVTTAFATAMAALWS